jgi:hypothetical protein
MIKVNFNAIKEHVSTQYGDLTGVIQIDLNSSITSIYDLCKDNNFDTSDKFIIGFGIGESSTSGIGRRGEVCCSILYVDKMEYGENFDAIQAKIKNCNTLKLKKKNIYIPYSTLGKYIKRFDFIVTNELTKHVTSLEIDEDDSEE